MAGERGIEANAIADDPMDRQVEHEIASGRDLRKRERDVEDDPITQTARDI